MEYTIYACAAVLAGIKPAELVRYRLGGPGCPSCWQAHKEALLSELGLCCVELQQTETSLLVLLYTPDSLEKAITKPEVMAVLGECSYALQEQNKILQQLKLRFEKEDFPHEIGLFLGYPPADVKSFIRHGGKDYAYCKYWKVYGDVKQAKLLMAKMDKAKYKAATMLTAGIKMPKLLRIMKTI